MEHVREVRSRRLRARGGEGQATAYAPQRPFKHQRWGNVNNSVRFTHTSHRL
jgi:hypothetical protein